MSDTTPCRHTWKRETEDDEYVLQRCSSCQLFRMARRSPLSRTADEIVETYQRRAYHFLDSIKQKYEPKWVELTLDDIRQIASGERPCPV